MYRSSMAEVIDTVELVKFDCSTLRVGAMHEPAATPIVKRNGRKAQKAANLPIGFAAANYPIVERQRAR
jgi:hypothetical protein